MRALVAEAVDTSGIGEARLDSATVRSSIVRRAKAYPKVAVVSEMIEARGEQLAHYLEFVATERA